MYKKDQVKGIIALILFGIIGISYYFFKDGDETLTISIICLLAWLLIMYVLNKREN